jgi:hypothetical protein
MRHDLPKRRPEQDSVLATGPRPERPGTRPEKIIGPQTATTSLLPADSSGYVLVCSVESPQVIAPFQPTRRRNLGLENPGRFSLRMGWGEAGLVRVPRWVALGRLLAPGQQCSGPPGAPEWAASPGMALLGPQHLCGT